MASDFWAGYGVMGAGRALERWPEMGRGEEDFCAHLNSKPIEACVNFKMSMRLVGTENLRT